MHIPLSQDAALVTTLAGTAMPFAHSAHDESERWLRALRLHGEVGSALQALGVGEAPLMTAAEAPDIEPAGMPPLGAEAMEIVIGQAEQFALAREAEAVGTTDVLFSLLAVYGRVMDRALYGRGTTRDELLERLARAGEAAEVS